MIVGAPSSCMELELYGVSDGFLLKMDDNNALLGSYPVDDECKIHVCSYFNAHLKLKKLVSYSTEKLQANDFHRPVFSVFLLPVPFSGC